MVFDNLIFYGPTANKIRELKENTGLFERMIDVYMAAGIVGVIFDKKGREVIDENKTTIFAGQLAGEAMRIKYLSSLAFLVENFNKEIDEQELLRLAFADWFNEINDSNIPREKDKHYLFKQYAIGGVDILYEEIMGQSTDKETYLRNYYYFINKIEKLDITDNVNRTIAGALL